MAGSYRIQAVTPPPVEPLELDEVKAHLRIESGLADEDGVIGDLIATAREACERFTGRALVRRSLKLSLDAWPRVTAAAPAEGWSEGALIEGQPRAVELPHPPLLAVDSVTLYGEADQATLWPASNYYVDAASEPGRLVARSGVAWPSATRAANAVEIVYQAGYAPDESGSPTDYRANLPAGLRDGMKRLVAWLYEQRGDRTDRAEALSGAAGLWRPYRVLRL